MHSTFAKRAEATNRRASHSAAETTRQMARTAGSSFLPLVQAKLRIGTPNNEHEREADRVADQVMKMPESQAAMIDSVYGPETVQRACAACTGGGGLCPECEEELRAPTERSGSSGQVGAGSDTEFVPAARSKHPLAARWRPAIDRVATRFLRTALRVGLLGGAHSRRSWRGRNCSFT